MESTDKRIRELKSYLKEVGFQIGALASKQKIAETVALKMSKDLHYLREQHTKAIQQLHDLELHRSGLYIWENIGEGG